MSTDPVPAAPPPVLRGPLPRILVQWLPDEDLRRTARLRGGSAAEAGEVRQLGIDWHHPLYCDFAAIADLAPAGTHLGSFLLQVGFRALVVQRSGAWMLDGPVMPAPGGFNPLRWTNEPSHAALEEQARREWYVDFGLDTGDRPQQAEEVRQRRIESVRALIEQDKARRDASIAAADVKLREHPLFNIDRFNEVATEVPQEPTGLVARVLRRLGLRRNPGDYRPPGLLRRAWWAFRMWWAVRRGGAS